MSYSEQIEFNYPYYGTSISAKLFIQIRYGSHKTEEWIIDKINHHLKVNGEKINPETLINNEDKITYEHARADEKYVGLDLQIIFEDEYYIVISKPGYLPVSPSGAYYYSSLAIQMKDLYPDIDISPVHRLDIETSGVLIFGKGKAARRKICKLFELNKITKQYEAIVWNEPKENIICGDIELDPDSKIYSKFKVILDDTSKTVTKILDCKHIIHNFYHLKIQPISGKTNQIRVHLAELGCPIVGDKKYYFDENVYLNWVEFRSFSNLKDKLILERQALHCRTISFEHPFSNKQIDLEDNSDQFLIKLKEIENS